MIIQESDKVAFRLFKTPDGRQIICFVSLLGVLVIYIFFKRRPSIFPSNFAIKLIRDIFPFLTFFVELSISPLVLTLIRSCFLSSLHLLPPPNFV